MVCSARCEWLAITLALCVGQAYGALSGESRRMAGAELAELRIEIASAPGSVLVRYRRVE